MEKREKIIKNNGRKVLLKIVSIFALIIVLGLVFVIVAVFVSYGKTNKYNNNLAVGEKYLSKMEYESAIASFTELVELKPKGLEGYVLLADTYIAVKEYDLALETIETGLANVETQYSIKLLCKRNEVLRLLGRESEISDEWNYSEEIYEIDVERLMSGYLLQADKLEYKITPEGYMYISIYDIDLYKQYTINDGNALNGLNYYYEVSMETNLGKYKIVSEATDDNSGRVVSYNQIDDLNTGIFVMDSKLADAQIKAYEGYFTWYFASHNLIQYDKVDIYSIEVLSFDSKAKKSIKRVYKNKHSYSKE